MQRFRIFFALATGILALSISTAHAQQQGQQNQQGQQGQSQSSPSGQAPSSSPSEATGPIPAYHSPLASGADQNNPDQGQAVQPDDTPLTGATHLTLGAPEVSRSYWQPKASVLETADSDALGTGTGWVSYTSLLGGVDVHKISGHSNFTLGYLGGGTISNDSTLGDSVIQEVSLAEKITEGRFVLSFLDGMDYLPEASFGYGGTGGASGISLPVGGVTSLQPGLYTDETIATTRGQRIDNTSIVELDTKLSRRSSITLLGGYSLLHYFDISLLDVNDVIAQAGYNRTLSKSDTIAVLYRFNEYSYSGLSQRIDDNVAQVSYGKRLTGRLAFQVAAGPEYTMFNLPVQTGTGTPTLTSASTSYLTWSLNASLTYQVRRGSLGLSYSHGLGGGSGVLTGAEADMVTGSASHQITRTVNGSLSGGYARNRGFSIGSTAGPNQVYDDWNAGAGLTRLFGRTLSMFLSYQLQYQDSNTTFCAGATCGTNYWRHLISVGLNWQSRPMLF
jgi:hypothetical protein